MVRFLSGRALRRWWRASVFLVLVAGIGGGVAMSAWAASRRASTSFDRFLDHADPPEVIVTFCPPDFVEVDEVSLVQCFNYDPRDEIEVMNAQHTIESAARVSFRGLSASPRGNPDARWVANAPLSWDPRTVGLEGRPIVVDGRMFDPDSAVEVVVNERFVEQSDVRIGDELDLIFWGPDEIGSLPEQGRTFSGPRATVRVVGVVRSLLDLSSRAQTASRLLDESEVIGGPALARASDGAGGYGGAVVSGTTNDIETTIASIEAVFPGRPLNTSEALSVDELDSVREAIDYESQAMLAVGVIASVAAAVVIGQAVGRQSRREWSDLPTLRALGVTRRDVVLTALIRSTSIALPAGLLAVGSAIASSPATPIGLARRAEVDRGMFADWTVLGLGAVAILVTVSASTVLTVMAHRPRASALSAAHASLARSWFPVTATAGIALTANNRRESRTLPNGTAFVGVALAVASVMAATTLVASLDEFTGTPRRFGAPWDASISDIGGDIEAFSGVEAVLADDPRVAAAAAIVGTDARVDGKIIWVQAFDTIGELRGIEPVINKGRAPAAANEIALAPLTMRELDADIGDVLDVSSNVAGSAVTQMTVVGTTVVNDTFETSPGHGGFVTIEWLESAAPEASADPYIVQLSSGTDADTFAESLRASLRVDVNPPVKHPAIQNVERIASLPGVLAAIICALAAASTAHAMVLTIRRARRQLAIWQSLGFTRADARAAVGWHAMTVAVVGLVAGAIIGLVVGHLMWQVITDRLGVESPSVVSIVGVCSLVVGAIVLIRATAAILARRAIRAPIAAALRAE